MLVQVVVVEVFSFQGLRLSSAPSTHSTNVLPPPMSTTFKTDRREAQALQSARDTSLFTVHRCFFHLYFQQMHNALTLVHWLY